MIEIDVSSPDTSLESVRKLAVAALDEDVREAAYDLFSYAFGQSDSVSDEALETVVNSGLQGTEVDSVDELRSGLEMEHERNVGGSEFEERLRSSMMDVFRYVFLGENAEAARQSQGEAISNDWDMSVNISLDGLDVPSEKL